MERCLVNVTRFWFIRLTGCLGRTPVPQKHMLYTVRNSSWTCDRNGQLKMFWCGELSKVWSRYLHHHSDSFRRSEANHVYKIKSQVKSITYQPNNLNCDLLQSNCDIMLIPPRIRLHSGIGLKSDFSKSSSGQIKLDPADSSEEESDAEDTALKPALEAITPNIEPPHYVTIVPGKGPPPEPPVDCCMSGCANCVWIQYCEELKHYFVDGTGQDIAKQAIENIENEGLKMFLKVELGFI